MKLPYFVLRDHIPNGGLRGANDLYNMLYVGFAWGQAAFLVAGGPRRWQGEQFSVARRLIPWSPYSWAVVLFVAALVLAVGILMPDGRHEDKTSVRAFLIVGGSLVCVIWCAYFAWCLYRAGQDYPTQVALTGPFQWSFFALWYMIKVGQHLEFRQRELTR